MRKLKAEQMAEMPGGTLFIFVDDDPHDLFTDASGEIRVFHGGMWRNDEGEWDWFDYGLEPGDGPAKHGLLPTHPVFFVLEEGEVQELRGVIDRALEASKVAR